MSPLARRGLQATSFSEVLANSGDPRGSVYVAYAVDPIALIA